MEIGAYEARTHLSRLLDEVAEGKRFTITKHGVPVAVLAPFGPGQRSDVASIIEQISRLRVGLRLGDLSLRELLEEGRR